MQVVYYNTSLTVILRSYSLELAIEHVVSSSCNINNSKEEEPNKQELIFFPISW